MIGELSPLHMEEVLDRNPVGRLGCSANGKTYVVPVCYVYDGRTITAHSLEGKKILMMRQNPEVCFEVDEMDDLDNWRSVIAWGRFEEIENEEERYTAMKKLVDRMMKLKVSGSAKPPHLNPHRTHPHQAGDVKVIVWRIVLTKKSGRFEQN